MQRGQLIMLLRHVIAHCSEGWGGTGQGSFFSIFFWGGGGLGAGQSHVRVTGEAARSESRPVEAEPEPLERLQKAEQSNG